MSKKNVQPPFLTPFIHGCLLIREFRVFILFLNFLTFLLNLLSPPPPPPPTSSTDHGTTVKYIQARLHETPLIERQTSIVSTLRNISHLFLLHDYVLPTLFTG